MTRAFLDVIVIWRSRLLPHVPGHSARWGNFHGWFMFSELHIDSTMSNMSFCLCCDLAFVPAPGKKGKGQRWFEDSVRASPSGAPHPSSTLQTGGGTVGSDWDLCRVRITTRFLRCSPWQHRRASSLRGWRLGCIAPFGCGSVVRARPRDDGYAFPGCRECRARVESPKNNIYIPPRPNSSRLDEWFLGGDRADSHRPPLVPFSRKCMRSLQDRGRHLSLPETNLGAPPPSPPSMVEPLWGTRASLQWSGLWPCNCVQTAATTLQGDPCLPSRACL